MAGSTKNRKRREAAEALQRASQSKRRRQRAIVAACAVVALVVVAIPVYLSVRSDSSRSGLASLGVSAGEAGCSPVSKHPANGSQQHEADGTPISYDQAPPAYGPHYPIDAPFGQTFYTPANRPPLGNLVHNLEHGYTILWYDDSVAGDGADMATLQAIADTFTSHKGYQPTDKFIVAPYTSQDPGAFPAGQRVALTHWSATFDNGLPINQEGITQYCQRVSGEVVAGFVKDYPYTDSPEPNAA